MRCLTCVCFLLLHHHFLWMYQIFMTILDTCTLNTMHKTVIIAIIIVPKFFISICNVLDGHEHFLTSRQVFDRKCGRKSIGPSITWPRDVGSRDIGKGWPFIGTVSNVNLLFKSPINEADTTSDGNTSRNAGRWNVTIFKTNILASDTIQKVHLNEWLHKFRD